MYAAAGVLNVRGVASHGMLCSAKELGLSEDASGLLVLPPDLPPGAALREVLDLDDQVLTTKPTPNRGDCLSILGMAREVAAITSARLEVAGIRPAHPATGETLGITLEAPQACPRYCGRLVRGIDARAQTPLWMAQRLARSGVRAVSGPREPDRRDQLVSGQVDAAIAREELRDRHAALAAQRDQDDLGVVGQQHRRQIGGRARVGDVAANGAHRTDRGRADGCACGRRPCDTSCRGSPRAGSGCAQSSRSAV
jgi:hypothetical protein